MDKYVQLTDRGPLGEGAFGVANVVKRKSDGKLFVKKTVVLEPKLNIDVASRISLNCKNDS